MNGLEEKELIDYLAGIGFTGEDFTTSIKEKIQLDAPNFTASYATMFGGDKMLFSLQFRKDRQFDAYRLESYNATLRRDMDIKYTVVNGIDTAKLEDHFKTVNWNKYFNDSKGLLTEGERQDIKSLLSDVWQLTAKPSEEGKRIQDILEYKYWPEHAWDDAAKDIKADNDQSRSFQASEYGICNTSLAYNHLSGRLEDLYEKLQVLQLEQYPGAQLYAELEKLLSATPDTIELKFQRNEPEGYIEYVIPASLIDGRYSIDTYQAVLTPYPPIEHGIYNGVDSRELEDLMKQIDWHDANQLFVFHTDSEPEFQPKVGDIQEQLYRLSQDMVGTGIADRLQLKYWSDATFFSDSLQQSAWDALDELPKRTHAFPVETNAKAAYNLLNGRAVLNTSLKHLEPAADEWTRLDFTLVNDRTIVQEVKVKGFSVQDMESQLELLPVNQSWYYGIRNSLLNGNLTSVTLRNERRLLMEANPEQKILNLYTSDMRPIPANLRLDPDWKPEIKNQNKVPVKQKQQQKYARPQPLKRHKGKGL